jgi:hypothetical protein
MDFTNVMPNLLNWALVGTMAVTFIAFFKFVTNMWQVPGLSQLFASI